jgi:NAD-dependent dihydropyrimidine dehydrogenase PreA subunit
MKTRNVKPSPLFSSNKVTIDINYCNGCGTCAANCPGNVFEIKELTEQQYKSLNLGKKFWIWIKGRKKSFVIHPEECIACKICEANCREKAIRINKKD